MRTGNVSYQGLAKIARERGDVTQAMEYYDLYMLYDDSLKQSIRTETIHKIELFRRSFSIPPAEKEAKCRACSLREHCRPGMQRSASNYCHELRREAMERDVK